MSSPASLGAVVESQFLPPSVRTINRVGSESWRRRAITLALRISRVAFIACPAADDVRGRRTVIRRCTLAIRTRIATYNVRVAASLYCGSAHHIMCDSFFVRKLAVACCPRSIVLNLSTPWHALNETSCILFDQCSSNVPKNDPVNARRSSGSGGGSRDTVYPVSRRRKGRSRMAVADGNVDWPTCWRYDGQSRRVGTYISWRTLSRRLWGQ